MSTVPLAGQLQRLLEGHEVASEVREGAVYVPSVNRWANLWMERSEGGTHLLELRATATGDQVIADRWAGIGEDPDRAVRDGIEAFCRGGFHVVLAALWGVLERDQVDHEVVAVGAQSWDLYLGPAVMRAGAGVESLVMPAEVFHGVRAALIGHLVDGDTHTMRVYVAVFDGAVTIETLVDDEDSPAVLDAVRSGRWAFPAKGFASMRWFSMARRRDPGPSHQIEGSCSGS